LPPQVAGRVRRRDATFLDNPLVTALAARSIRENGTLALPFGTGRTSGTAVTTGQKSYTVTVQP
jgi:hypothetical protein